MEFRTEDPTAQQALWYPKSGKQEGLSVLSLPFSSGLECEGTLGPSQETDPYTRERHQRPRIRGES